MKIIDAVLFEIYVLVRLVKSCIELQYKNLSAYTRDYCIIPLRKCALAQSAPVLSDLRNMWIEMHFELCLCNAVKHNGNIRRFL